MTIQSAVRNSFLRVKEDILNLREWCDSWFSFLDDNQRRLTSRIKVLEKKIEELEQEKIKVY